MCFCICFGICTWKYTYCIICPLKQWHWLWWTSEHLFSLIQRQFWHPHFIIGIEKKCGYIQHTCDTLDVYSNEPLERKATGFTLLNIQCGRKDFVLGEVDPWELRTNVKQSHLAFQQSTSQSVTSALGPVATRTRAVKDQTSSTVLKVGLAAAAVVELVLVLWVGIHAVGLSSTEPAVHAAGAGAPTRGAAATGASSRAALGRAHSGDRRKFSRWCGAGWKNKCQ